MVYGWANCVTGWPFDVRAYHRKLRTTLWAAFEWLTEHEPEAGLRLAGALWWFWYLRGYWGRDTHGYILCWSVPQFTS